MAPKQGKTPSKADRLIQEAIEALDAQKSRGEEVTDIQEKNRTSSSVARIDLQKFVEKEAYLRLAADFENFRKRALKERNDAERAGKESLLRDFLEIFDNIERGLKQTDDNSALSAGMKMVISQTETWLTSQGLHRIPTLGKKFDPVIHEAIAQQPSSQVESGYILEEVKRGYRWSDRLLRPASVVVCQNPVEES